SEVVRRPSDPAMLSDAEWVDYLYNHSNLEGWVREQWWHARGCRRWIVVERNTSTHEIGETVPAKP
ncbi:MAG: sarcosine oxidase subunit delta, partial [Gammaproteobacteria bacterium]